MSRFRAFTQSANGILNTLTTPVVVVNPTDDTKGIKCNAVWDTGATKTCVTSRIAKLCELPFISKATVSTASGDSVTSVYLASIFTPAGVRFTGVTVCEAILTGEDVLIGMDIICTGDFVVTNHEKKTVFSFRTPSEGKVDFVNGPFSWTTREVGRNDPCICGSGKKSKHCCNKPNH